MVLVTCFVIQLENESLPIVCNYEDNT